jgi:hypothetical protein
MASHLLSIALTVEQHDKGDFYWVILESFDDSMEFEPLMEAGKGFQTYIDALQAGYVALKGLSDDLKIGPRDDNNSDTGDEEPLADPR